MAADDDGQQRSSKRRGVDEASEAQREKEEARQSLLATIDELKRDLEARGEERGRVAPPGGGDRRVPA